MFELIYIFIVGAIMGSFYYVVGTRLAHNESLVTPRSHCENCKHPLGILDLVPILSFIFLRGKCRYCKEKISIKYLLYEILTGILFTLSYYRFGISYEFFISLIISSLVVIIFITDFNDMIILDSPIVIATILVLIIKFIYFGYKEVLFSLLSGILAFITMYLIGFIGKKIFKREALGGGDIKFMFVAGVILSYKYALIMLILSNFVALPYAFASILLNKKSEVPFGPFLVGSLFIVFFFLNKFKYIVYLFM